MPHAAPALPPGYRLLALGETDSTNAEAMRLAAAGETGPLWIQAATQALGRGRSGRTWTSVPGNLYASLLIRTDCPPHAIHQLSLLAGVAAHDAIRAVAASAGTELPGLRLKWPNDVLIGGAKLAGILPESTTGPGGSSLVAIIGVGINLAGHPANLGRAVTHLAAHGCRTTPAGMLGSLAAAIDDWLGRWDDSSGFQLVREAWLSRAGAPGEPVHVNTGRELVEGTFLGIDAEGALVLRDLSGAERRFTYGDVTLGAAAGARG
ncbi:MAG: biotin--[acetyl-CoA-carboxylase] ligase [Hyphomicrobiaceae bacterium]|nr:biotin--[acetyl-CoA-carboxylase] ligase [Hyphomicrobiaceae bacterium]